MAFLVILGGRPGVGKTTIARELARRIGAVHLRIDSIEEAIGPTLDMADLGYRVAYAVAGDNLRLGLTVVADCVNPIEVTRRAWRNVAAHAGVRAVEIEIVCSDVAEHRRRVDGRTSPRWGEVVSREYESWGAAHTIDTATRTLEECVREILAVL